MSAKKDAAVGFLTMVAAGEIDEAYERHIGPGLVHHNQHFKGDVASLKQAMKDNHVQNPGKSLEVKRALEDGALVAVHSHVRQSAEDAGFAVVHIFRFDGDRVVEMWDVGQAVAAKSPNENGVF
jgi:predicted SnoaL-like aldol condensation-catalyzing enzyme